MRCINPKTAMPVNPQFRAGLIPREIAPRFCCLAVLLAALLPAIATAAALYDSSGFEQPRFLPTANLAGQDSPPAGQGPWTKDSGTSSAVVQNAVVAGGLQAVRITRAASSTGDTRWAVQEPFTPTGLENRVQIDFDLRVEQATFTPPDFGPVFGIEAYDASDPANPLLIGSVTLDARTGDVLYQQAETGFLTDTGTVLARGVFHHLTLIANFANKTYSIFANGTLLRTEGFVDAAADSFTDAPLSTFAATPGSISTATGTAYFDNYVIMTIPEPGTASLLLPVALLLGSRLTRRTPA